MMKLLEEMKGVHHTLAEPAYYGFQAFLRSEDSRKPLQTKVVSMFQRQARSEAARGGKGAQGKVVIMTRKVGTC